MWAAYEVTYTYWLFDPNSKEDISDTKLRVLASVELLYNVISVFLSCLLFRMVDHITRPVEECYFDPHLQHHVPFFVYLANCKLIKQHNQDSPTALLTASNCKTEVSTSQNNPNRNNSGSPMHSPPSEYHFSEHGALEYSSGGHSQSTGNIKVVKRQTSLRSEKKQPSPPVGLQRGSRVTTMSSRRGGKLTELDRELIRSEQTY